uniref:Transmembrane protein n=1 Tax=Panagrellus redivivus TaxID=6233 RepID=A0A7E4VA25_PANRE
MQCSSASFLQRLINISSIFPVYQLTSVEVHVEYSLLTADISCHILTDIIVIYFIGIYLLKLHKLYHANLCVFLIAFFVIYWCYEFSAIVLYTMALFCSFEDLSMNGPAYPVYIFREGALIAGINLIMFLSLNLFHASQNVYTYENMRHPVFAIVSIFIVVTFTSIWSVCRYIKIVPQVWPPFAMAASSLVAAIVMFFTRRRNKELMKKYFEMSLGVKYQFYENLRVSRPLFPVLQSASLGAFSGGVCYQIAASMSANPSLSMLMNTAYSLCMITFMGIITLVMIFSLSETKSLIVKMFFGPKIEPAPEEGVIYFSQLHDQWHKGPPN